jgi:hypothetical protein
MKRQHRKGYYIDLGDPAAAKQEKSSSSTLTAAHPVKEKSVAPNHTETVTEPLNVQDEKALAKQTKKSRPLINTELRDRFTETKETSAIQHERRSTDSSFRILKEQASAARSDGSLGGVLWIIIVVLLILFLLGLLTGFSSGGILYLLLVVALVLLILRLLGVI